MLASISVLMSFLYYIAVAATSLAVGIFIGRKSKVGRVVEAMHELRGKGEGQNDRP